MSTSKKIIIEESVPRANHTLNQAPTLHLNSDATCIHRLTRLQRFTQSGDTTQLIANKFDAHAHVKQQHAIDTETKKNGTACANERTRKIGSD